MRLDLDRAICPMLPKRVRMRHYGAHDATVMRFQDRTLPAADPSEVVRAYSACRRRGT